MDDTRMALYRDGKRIIPPGRIVQVLFRLSEWANHLVWFQSGSGRTRAAFEEFEFREIGDDG